MKENEKGPINGDTENKNKRSPLMWIIPALIGLGIAGVVTYDRLTLVKPAWPLRRAGNPVPALPRPDDTPFRRTPSADTFKQRRRRYLNWAARQPVESGRDSIWAEILKMEGGQEYISEEILDWSLEFVNRRNDCADFVVNALLRLWFKYAGTGKLKPRQETAIKETLLGFMFWMDEPNPLKTDIIHYTENHQIMYHTAEYLAGQLFPGTVFTNNGRLGRWHMDHARALIDRWIDFHSRTGFAEWDSINYYPCNLGALLNLVDFAADEVLSARAAMLVDLILFDLAVDSFYGQYGSSHGRIEDHHIKSASGDEMVTTQALLWGWGRFQSASDIAAISFAAGERYRLPPILEAIARDIPTEMSNYERHSIKLSAEDAFKHDLRCKNIHDAPRWLGMGFFLHPQIIGTILKMADEWDLWHLGGTKFERLKKVVRIARRLNIPLKGIEKLGFDLAGTELTEVNKITYRTPDYMLSCAQDYRKGEMGYQQHIWQATLSPYAVVFVTNPDSMREDGLHRPGYWAGNGRLPCAAQYKNLLIALYDIDRNKGVLESRHYAFTHAYFPRFAFDEVVEKIVFPGGWVFGRKDDGYIALYSYLPFEWQYEGPDAAREIIAVGRRNAWICLMGRREVDGTFKEFMRGVLNSALYVEGLNVDFDAPRLGRVQFGWNLPLTVKSREIPLSYYPRWHNPYSHTEFNTGRIKIAHGGEELLLDFDRGNRTITKK